MEHLAYGDHFDISHALVPVAADPVGVPWHQVHDVGAAGVVGAVAVGAVKELTVVEMAVAGRHRAGDRRQVGAGGDVGMLEQPVTAAPRFG